jgi:hypothetical protein
VQRAWRLILLLMIILLGSQAASCSPDDKLRGYLGQTPWPSAGDEAWQDFQDAYWSVFQRELKSVLQPFGPVYEPELREYLFADLDGDGEGELVYALRFKDAGGKQLGAAFVLYWKGSAYASVLLTAGYEDAGEQVLRSVDLGGVGSPAIVLQWSSKAGGLCAQIFRYDKGEVQLLEEVVCPYRGELDFRERDDGSTDVVVFSAGRQIQVISGRELFPKVGPEVPRQTRRRARDEVLQVVRKAMNERVLPSLVVDERASLLAESFAQRCSDYGYLAFRDNAGFAFYHRYSLSGETDYVSLVSESLAVVQGELDLNQQEEIAAYFRSLASTLLERSIPQGRFTHLGIGLGISPHQLTLFMVFIGRHIHIDPVERLIQSAEETELAARLINPQASLEGIWWYYEPYPEPLSLQRLRMGDLPPYWPDTKRWLRRQLSPGSYYASDGSRGEVEITSEGFKVKLPFDYGPGVYTGVVYLSTGGGSYPAGLISFVVRDQP